MWEGTLEWNNVYRTQDERPSNQQQGMNTGWYWTTTEECLKYGPRINNYRLVSEM